MSSQASKRNIKRQAGQSPVGKMKKQITAMQAELGQAKMAVLNMRQLYRQAEQEILQARQVLGQRESLIAMLVYLFGGDDEFVTVPQDVPALVDAEFQGFSFSEGEDGALIVTLNAVPLDAEVEVPDEVDEETE